MHAGLGRLGHVSRKSSKFSEEEVVEDDEAADLAGGAEAARSAAARAATPDGGVRLGMARADHLQHLLELASSREEDVPIVGLGLGAAGTVVQVAKSRGVQGRHPVRQVML